MRNVKKIITLALIAILLVSCGPESTKKDSKRKEINLETKTETISKEVSKDNNSKKEVSADKEESKKDPKKDESAEEIAKSEKTDSKETKETSVEPKPKKSSSNPEDKIKEVENTDKDNNSKKEVSADKEESKKDPKKDESAEEIAKSEKTDSKETKETSVEPKPKKNSSNPEDKIKEVENTDKDNSAKETEIETEAKEPVKKKTNEEIAKEVLNGSWGSGQDRKNRLESAGYNYSEVQAILNKIAPAPVVQKRRPVSSGSAKTQSNTNSVVASMPNNSILINGVVLRVSNNATQAGIDAGGRRIVNWGVEYIGNKTVGGPSAYFALHNKPYGYMFQNASSFIFKDINGNVKTYNIESRTGVRNWQPNMSDDAFAYTRGDMGDRIAVQTCIDTSGSSRYRIHVFS